MCHARQGSEQMAAAAQDMENQPREQLVDRRTGLQSLSGQLGPALRQDEGPGSQVLVKRPQASRQLWPSRNCEECVSLHMQVPY